MNPNSRISHNFPGKSAGMRTVAPDGRDFFIRLSVLYMVLFATLSVIYAYYVHPSAAYMGFDLDVRGERIVVSICVILFYCIIIPKRIGARSFFLNIILTIQLVPSLVIYSLGGGSAASAYVIWLAVLLVHVTSALPVLRPHLMNIDPRRLMWGLVACIVAFTAVLFFLGGFRNFNLDIRRVYEFRDASSDNLPDIFGYLMPIFSKIVIPFGISLSLFYKRRIIMIAFLILSVILFGVANHRGIIVYPLISIAVFYGLSFSRKYSVFLMIFILLISIAFFDSYMYFNLGSESIWGWYTDLFIRRGLMLPSILDYFHIDFFSENQKYFWSSSRITFGMVSNPYGILHPYIIGEAYFNDVNANAGTGYIGSGFAQAGIPGVVIYSVGVGIVIAAIDSFGRYLGLPVVAAVMAVQVMTMLTATDFVTMFLTHGLIVSFLLLAIVRTPADGFIARGDAVSRRPVGVF